MKGNKYTERQKPRGRKQFTTQMKMRRKTGTGRILREAIVQFGEYHPVDRLSRNLRTMLIEFLMFDGAIESSYLQDLLYDIQGLFELLEVIERESQIERKESG